MIILSQRDPKWASETIGNSTTTIGKAGCTITCISMLSDWYGCYKDPAWMAKNLSFLNDLVIWKSIEKNLNFKFVWRFYKYNEGIIVDALNGKDTSVILQVHGNHWVVALRKIGIYYWVADPWTGTKKLINKNIISGGSTFTNQGKLYDGVDLSHYNKITDWDKIDTGFIFNKCTEGVEIVDCTYAVNRDKANERGIPFGAYHYADGGNPITEAKHFIETAGQVEMYALDWEIEHPETLEWCTEFMNFIENSTGKRPYFYTNDNRAVKYDWPSHWIFWIARYMKDGSKGPEPNFKNWTIWQWSSKGSVPGIQGFVDLNIKK